MAVGVDVHCYYQRGIRWNEVSGVGYVWVKVSDGTAPYTKTVGGVTYRPDTMVQGAKSRGIPVGGYHYAQPGNPRAQADLLIREVKRLGATGVLPALDIEAPFEANATARTFGEAFCNRVRELGFRPVVYMSDSFARALQPASWASKPVLWIARYGSKPVSTRYDIHQYIDNGSLPGAASSVDFNEAFSNSHLNTPSSSQIGDEMDLQDTVKMWNDDQNKPRVATVEQCLASSVGHAEYIEKQLAALTTAVAKFNGISSTDLAAALLPGLTNAIKAQLIDVDGLDEDAVAEKLATNLAARLAS